MKKECILDEFKEINFMYNDATRYDLLSNMLDDLLEDKTPLEPVATSCTTTENTNAAIITKITKTFICGECDKAILQSNNYCPHCGRQINWKAYYERIV